MRVTIKYFALIREAASGRESESWEIAEGTPAGALFQMMADRYGLLLGPGDALVAVNDRYANMDRKLSEGDIVVFMPPLAGG